MKHLIITMVASLVIHFLSNAGFCQSVDGPGISDSCTCLEKSGSNPSYTYYNMRIVATSSITDLLIGNSGVGGQLGSPLRDCYQWNLPTSIIPSGSQIDSVRVFFEYEQDNTIGFIHAYFYNIRNDLNGANLDTLWNHFSNPYSIGDSYGFKTGTGSGSDIDSVKTTYYSGGNFVNALQSSFPSGRFVVGIMANGDQSYAYAWLLVNPTLTIWYTPPGGVTIDQKVVIGTSKSSYGSVGV